MDFEVQALLGGCFYGAIEAAEVLAAVEAIPGGDFEAWTRVWLATGERLEAEAERSDAAAARVSARKAHLRAATAYATALIFLDGSEDPGRGRSIWERHMACWEAFCSRLDPPAERIGIPLDGATMPGWLFRPDQDRRPRPTIIFVNGSDGATAAMWGFGVAAALERGYAAFVFDGPGQNTLFWRDGIPFRHDWEAVITPVVDALLSRSDVDGRRLVLSGLSQGGHWILRALAHEHRIAAGIADPAVMQVGTSIFRELPPPLLELFEAGREQEFNTLLRQGVEQEGPAARQVLEWRFKPYQPSSEFDLFVKVKRYDVSDLLGQIRCPMFIADPEDEQFWPGQSRQVQERLQCSSTLARFTAAEGANWHCEPLARGLFDQRMHDWLASALPA